jgi:hypothetical protein
MSLATFDRYSPFAIPDVAMSLAAGASANFSFANPWRAKLIDFRIDGPYDSFVRILVHAFIRSFAFVLTSYLSNKVGRWRVHWRSTTRAACWCLCVPTPTLTSFGAFSFAYVVARRSRRFRSF